MTHRDYLLSDFVEALLFPEREREREKQREAARKRAWYQENRERVLAKQCEERKQKISG